MAQDPKYVPMHAGINGGLIIIQKYTTLTEAADANILCLGITEFTSKMEVLNIYFQCLILTSKPHTSSLNGLQENTWWQ